MILTVTPNPALDKTYWVEHLSGDPETPLARAYRSQVWPGGKGINISILLARLGVENIAMGFIAGHTGRVIEQRVREEGVATNFIWTDGETRGNVTILERGKGSRPLEVSETGPEVSHRAVEQFLRSYRRHLPRTQFVVLGGSLPPGVHVEFYRQLIELAHQRGVRVFVNAAGAPLTEAIQAKPFLVKPDTRERREALGQHLDDLPAMQALAQRILSAGTSAVLISHGITHDLLVTHEGMWDLEALDVRFSNLVGAEDALIGGLVYRIAAGATLIEAATYGMAAATASAESDEEVAEGPAAVEQALPRIKVVKLT